MSFLLVFNAALSLFSFSKSPSSQSTLLIVLHLPVSKVDVPASIINPLCFCLHYFSEDLNQSHSYKHTLIIVSLCVISFGDLSFELQVWIYNIFYGTCYSFLSLSLLLSSYNYFSRQQPELAFLTLSSMISALKKNSQKHISPRVKTGHFRWLRYFCNLIS